MQLALVGSMAHDDPEGWDYYNRTVAMRDGDPDIYILSNLNNVGSVEVNAFQVHSAAVMQKSIKEGFGLTVSEALWKGRPTVAGRVGGISRRSRTARPAGSSTSSEDAPQACLEILADPARRGACAARQGVRAPALPHAAAAPRLARAVQPARGQRHGARGRTSRRAVSRAVPDSRRRAPQADRRLEPGPVTFARDTDGERIAQRGGGGLVTALRASSPITTSPGSQAR